MCRLWHQVRRPSSSLEWSDPKSEEQRQRRSSRPKLGKEEVDNEAASCLRGRRGALLCDFIHGITFLGCALSPRTVSGLQAAFSSHACTTHLSPKAGTAEACKEVAWLTGPERQALLGGGGQVTKLGQDSMVGVPHAQEAVGCGDWTTAVGEVKAAGHRHTGPRVCHLAVGRRPSCGGILQGLCQI